MPFLTEDQLLLQALVTQSQDQVLLLSTYLPFWQVSLEVEPLSSLKLLQLLQLHLLHQHHVQFVHVQQVISSTNHHQLVEHQVVQQQELV